MQCFKWKIWTCATTNSEFCELDGNNKRRKKENKEIIPTNNGTIATIY